MRVSRKGEGKGPRVMWSYHQHALRATGQEYALLVTDPKLSVKEVVDAYLERDFIEKGFRAMKTDEEMEPTRHHWERRVQA
ncbi:transposase [mine drainage metagenome]|uniref:Transposase n=1 Tax=mine drainage metagenome TaxID=410659 RepID=T0ZYZ0_9ZZZZ